MNSINKIHYYKTIKGLKQLIKYTNAPLFYKVKASKFLFLKQGLSQYFIYKTKNTLLMKYNFLALGFAFALGVFLYVYFEIIFFVFLPPLFIYLFNKNKKQFMSKSLIRVIGIQIIVIGLVLSVFEFLIDNSELIVGIGVIILVVSFFFKSN